MSGRFKDANKRLSLQLISTRDGQEERSIEVKLQFLKSKFDNPEHPVKVKLESKFEEDALTYDSKVSPERSKAVRLSLDSQSSSISPEQFKTFKSVNLAPPTSIKLMVPVLLPSSSQL